MGKGEELVVVSGTLVDHQVDCKSTPLTRSCPPCKCGGCCGRLRMSTSLGAYENENEDRGHTVHLQTLPEPSLYLDNIPLRTH